MGIQKTLYEAVAPHVKPSNFQQHVFEEIEMNGEEDGREFSWSDSLCVKCGHEESFIYEHNLPCLK